MNSEMFQVQGVLNRRTSKGGLLEYLIMWKGYNTSQATWEPAHTLSSIKPLIDLYNRSHPEKPKQKHIIVKQKQVNKSILKQNKMANQQKNSQLEDSIKKDYYQTKFIQPQKRQKLNVSKIVDSEHFSTKKQSKLNRYQIKLDQKITKKNIHIKEASKEVNENQIETAENNEAETVEVLKIVFLASENKKLFETRVNTSIILLQAQKLKSMYPIALCNFYERIIRFDP